MIPRIEKSGMEYRRSKLDALKELVTEPEIDYYRIVYEVESIL